jgi:hypothetical protein
VSVVNIDSGFSAAMAVHRIAQTRIAQTRGGTDDRGGAR